MAEAKKNEKKDKTPTEKDEQIALCQWLDKKKIRYFATAMGVWLGTKKNYKYINSLKKRGFKSGVPDIVVLLDNGITAFIELKRTKGGNKREDQKEWIEWLNAHGYPSAFCYGAIGAVKFILKLMTNVDNEKEERR